MALQLGALRTALLDAGASPDKADDAAAEVAGYESRFASLELKLERLDGRVNLLTWAVGANAALTLAVFVKLFIH